MNFTNNLKNLRIQFGYTQAQLAEMLNIKQQSYSRYEKGTGEPNIATLCKLADIFDVSVDTLIGRVHY